MTSLTTAPDLRQLLLDAAAGASSLTAAMGRMRATALGFAQGMTDAAPDGRLRADLRTLFSALDEAVVAIEERYRNV